MTPGVIIALTIIIPFIIFIGVSLYAMEVPYEERQARLYDRKSEAQHSLEETALIDGDMDRAEIHRELSTKYEDIAADWRDEYNEKFEV